jgi:hypothetical protein
MTSRKKVKALASIKINQFEIPAPLTEGSGSNPQRQKTRTTALRFQEAVA